MHGLGTIAIVLSVAACGRVGYDGVDNGCPDGVACLVDPDGGGPLVDGGLSAIDPDGGGPANVAQPTVPCAGASFATGWEGGSADELGGSLEGDGGATAQNLVSFRGGWALEVDTSRGASTGFADSGRTDQDIDFHQFYFRVDLLPASGSDPIFISDSGASFDSDSVEIRIDHQGYLSVFQRDTAGATPDQWQALADMATARPGRNLAAGIWYLIEVKVSQATQTYELRVNGQSLLGGDVTPSLANQDRYAWGKYIDYSGSAVIFYYDEVAGRPTNWLGGCYQ